jgi:hypothetical protein
VAIDGNRITEIATEFCVLTITLGYLLPAFCEIMPLPHRAIDNYDRKAG